MGLRVRLAAAWQRGLPSRSLASQHFSSLPEPPESQPGARALGQLTSAFLGWRSAAPRVAGASAQIVPARRTKACSSRRGISGAVRAGCGGGSAGTASLFFAPQARREPSGAPGEKPSPAAATPHPATGPARRYLDPCRPSGRPRTVPSTARTRPARPHPRRHHPTTARWSSPRTSGLAIVRRRFGRTTRIRAGPDAGPPAGRPGPRRAVARRRKSQIEAAGDAQARERLGPAQDGLRDRPAHRGRLPLVPLRGADASCSTRSTTT